ncbi:MAG: DinB family protein [Longimicrobiales bacterium]
MRYALVLPLMLAGLAAAAPAAGQSSPTDYRDQILGHFEGSARKMSELSKAMPAETYAWSPEGAFTVARVYGHIARYNYLYLEENLGIAAPDGVDWENFETITDKETVVRVLDESIAHVRRAMDTMTEADLTRQATLYGREVAGWAVLTQLVAHMNEHVGQAIAYARMNRIVPPWSM